jgi:predicted component of viral defense system (DUF524 family)
LAPALVVPSRLNPRLVRNHPITHNAAMDTIEVTGPDEAQCPLRLPGNPGAAGRPVPDMHRQMLAPAEWIVYEWTPHIYTWQGATHLRVGSRELEPLVDGVFRIQFENQLGLTSITPYCDGLRLAPPVYVEVIASKFKTPGESIAFLKHTLDDLFSRFSTIPFKVSAMTERMVRESPAPPNLLFAFHFLCHHHQTFIEAVQAILGRPHQRLTDVEEQVRPHQVRRIDRESMIRMLQGGRSSHTVATRDMPTLTPLERLRPERVWQRRPEETYDTPENRYVLHICRRMLETIVEIARTGWWRNRVPLRDKLHIGAVAEELTMLTVDRRFAALGPMTAIPIQSRVLQRKDGYRELGVLWQQLRRSRQPVFERMETAIDLRDVASLYELWALFKLIDEIAGVTGIVPTVSSTFGPFGEPGEDQTFTFPGYGVLLYNQGRRGYSRISLRPDYLWEPLEGDWVAFDAKFRMDKPEELVDDETGESSYVDMVTSKNNDWQKMHTYRDGLSRVRAAVVLYPGEEQKFRDITGALRDVAVADLLSGDLNGIGAIPLTPLGVPVSDEWGGNHE